MGAWIETFLPVLPIGQQIWSLPSWERGLKLLNGVIITKFALSLPSWERGLKLEPLLTIVGEVRRSLHGSVD